MKKAAKMYINSTKGRFTVEGMVNVLSSQKPIYQEGKFCFPFHF